MKRIVYTDLDGNLCVIIPAPSWTGTIKELADKDVPQGLNYKIVNENDIPSDRTFRGAWVLNAGVISHDMKKAKEIKRNMIREERKLKFTALDNEINKELVKAITTGDNSLIVELEGKRKVLRDAPAMPEIESAETIEDLAVIHLPEV
jgi:hypothetical protein